VFVSLFQDKFSANFTSTKLSTFARGEFPSQAGSKSLTSGNSNGSL